MIKSQEIKNEEIKETDEHQGKNQRYIYINELYKFKCTKSRNSRGTEKTKGRTGARAEKTKGRTEKTKKTKKESLGVVQSGRMLALGASGRRFESFRRDHFVIKVNISMPL